MDWILLNDRFKTLIELGYYNRDDKLANYIR